MLPAVYRVQVRDAWGLWVDVAEFYSEDRARRFVEALRRDFPRMELRVVRERVPATSLAVVACVVAVLTLPAVLSLLLRRARAS
jgi:hypothetical protein